MAAVSNANFQQIPTHSNAPYISAKQRLLNDWADANIAPNMIQGKIVKRKRSGDNKENANSQNSKRSKSTNSATKNAVPLENPVVLQNIVNSNNLQNIVAQNAVGRTFKRRGSSQNLAEKKGCREERR
ncbi:unnamed protein product [Caenorhabditis angaria]|uniref:Uncharacterized protein n=1 Tax=Caenorhabditis angaria TaxID=860376 RepID=A0A9P1NA28_9PELO|nr:unnamed protein product [Caenorhabditis angaria]